MREKMNFKSDRLPRHIPAEFLEVQNKLWSTAGKVEEQPIAVFQIPNNTLELNLHAITEIVVTCQDKAFGMEVVFEDRIIDPNMLVMGSLSVAATLQAWQQAQIPN